MGFGIELGTKINGRYYDYSSIEISVLGGVYVNMKSIKYKQALDPGKFRGTGAKIRGLTRGVHDVDGSFEIYVEDYQKLKLALATLGQAQRAGYMVVTFPIVVSMSDFGANIRIVDTLKGCRIVSEEQSYSEGNDPLFVSCDLIIADMDSNGLNAVDAPLSLPSIPGL